MKTEGRGGEGGRGIFMHKAVKNESVVEMQQC